MIITLHYNDTHCKDINNSQLELFGKQGRTRRYARILYKMESVRLQLQWSLLVYAKNNEINNE